MFVCQQKMDSTAFCGICLITPQNFNDCVAFKSTMEIESFSEEIITYLDCFEFVTHLKIDMNVMQNLYLCPLCRCQLEGAFKFLRKAEKSQMALYEKIELEQTRKQNEVYQDLDFNDLIEEIVNDDYSAEPVLTDAMLGTSSTDDAYFDAFSESESLPENTIGNINLSPLSGHEVQLTLTDAIISSADIKFDDGPDDEICIQNEAEAEKYSCSVCLKTFNTLNRLRTHLKYHKRKKANIQSDACSICEKTFSTASYLRQHMEQVHADERQQFECDECAKVYFTKSALKNHKRFHTGDTMNCVVCHKGFVTQYDLKVHMRFHQLDYPFACTVCNKKFAIKGHLNTHMREHRGLKLQCEDCGKLFTSTKALLDHSFVHIGKMPFPCGYCKKSYPSKQKYKTHLLSAHKIEFDELEHKLKLVTTKTMPRRRNLTLVQADI